MPNQIRPVLTSQIGAFMETPENAAEIKAWAQHCNVTHGTVMRLIVKHGARGAAGKLRAEYGQRPDSLYEQLLDVERRRGAERAAAGAAAKRTGRRDVAEATAAQA